MLSFIIKSFTCSKEGNLPDENEDALFVPSKPDSTHLRIAIADGATESSFSREWADLLVSYYDAFKFDDLFNSSLHSIIRRNWLDRINTTELPWYAEQKLELGAFASFLGADINVESGTLGLAAVGDSNAFVFRKGKMELAFPIEKSTDFGNNPFLISSDSSKNRSETRFFFQETFPLISGDTILIGTDAICQWILRKVEAADNPLLLEELLLQDDNTSAVQAWLDKARETNEIKNDDTTIVLIKAVDATTDRPSI